MLTKIRSWWKLKWLRASVFILLTWFSIHVIYIVSDGLKNFQGHADVAIVLGNEVFADGSLASWTKGRVDRALQLYREGKVKIIFASGGFSIESNYPEGKAMKNYLVQRGVPDSAIIEDNNGQNTFLTARDFLMWNKMKACKSVVIVSQFYHITRSKYILKKIGFTGNIYSASSTVFSWRDIFGTMREVPAFYKYLLFY